MRAPDPTSEHSEVALSEQWLQVKNLLHKLGIDADTVMDGKEPLQAALRRLAADYNDKSVKPLTGSQFNAQINEELAAIAAFRARYEGDTLSRHLADKTTIGRDRSGMRHYSFTSTVDDMLATLKPLEATLRRQLRPDDSRNAAKDRRDWHWYQLDLIWKQTIVPLANRQPQRRQRVDFLVACTGASDSAVNNFLDRLPGKKRRMLDDPLDY